ncbi:MAG TPA: alpha/beta hydrolase [Minicystis sp.]|nr:alpha/beta hydrolase [Minicystis sp.]
MAERFDLFVLGARLEAARWGPAPDEAATLVLLHEGLGCVDAWRDFPDALAAATGLGVFAYSRLGYGLSDPVAVPRPLTYMHDEGRRVLPAVLDAAGVRDAVLVGRSDGASIAIVHAGSDAGPRLRGLALLAPHVFCEDISVEAIARARDAFEHGDLRDKLARRHGANVDCAFWGWNRAWLDPAFRAWNLEAFVPQIEPRVPVLVVQGRDDPYGTLRQVDAIEAGVRGPFERVVLDGVGHAPERDRPAETVAAVARLTRRALA